MIHETLQSMLSEIELHKGTDRSELLAQYVLKRLETSLRTYYKEILDSYNVLSRHNEENVLRLLIKK